MSSMDKTPATILTDPLSTKTTTEPAMIVWLTNTVTCQSESCAIAESQQVSKGHPRGPCRWQLGKQHGRVYCEHSGRGQKRKYQAEGKKAWQHEEPILPLKRLKPQQWEIELGVEEPGQGLIQNPQEEVPFHQKTPEFTKGPEEQAVTETKSVDGGNGPKGPYSNIEEYVQKHLNGMYPSLLGNCQPWGSVSSDSQNAFQHPLDSSKDIKGCVDAQIHASQTPQICENRVSNGILPKQMPIADAKEKASQDQKQSTGLDHGPLVTADMQKEISSALGPGPQDQVLSCAFNMTITRADMRTLSDSAWLNDNVINFYMNLLVDRNQTQGYPALYAFNTFFYTKLKSGGYRSVRRWTKAVNLFAKELILVPVHLDVHWSLVVTDLREKSIVYLDSMGHKRPDVLELIFHYLQDESKARRHVDLNPSEWKQYSMPTEKIPQQGNDRDCGVFTCKYADYISRGCPITFSQQHMPLFRKRMVWEILHQSLL